MLHQPGKFLLQKNKQINTYVQDKDPNFLKNELAYYPKNYGSCIGKADQIKQRESNNEKRIYGTIYKSSLKATLQNEYTKTMHKWTRQATLQTNVRTN